MENSPNLEKLIHIAKIKDDIIFTDDALKNLKGEVTISWKGNFIIATVQEEGRNVTAQHLYSTQALFGNLNKLKPLRSFEGSTNYRIMRNISYFSFSSNYGRNVIPNSKSSPLHNITNPLNFHINMSDIKPALKIISNQNSQDVFSISSEFP